jgi:hypothetical protein
MCRSASGLSDMIPPTFPAKLGVIGNAADRRIGQDVNRKRRRLCDHCL